jgi:hypothetical protein
MSTFGKVRMLASTAAKMIFKACGRNCSPKYRFRNLRRTSTIPPAVECYTHQKNHHTQTYFLKGCIRLLPACPERHKGSHTVPARAFEIWLLLTPAEHW